MVKRIVLCIAALVLFTASANCAEGAWLSGIPKADRRKLSSAFASLKSIGEKIRDARISAVRHEAQYARKARSLAPALDGSSSTESLSALSDQRLLRWESARELAEGRYGRAAKAGFESFSVLEAKLEADGAVFSAALSKQLPKLKRAALASLIADLENRMASHPDCPQIAFSTLRAEAASLSTADKGRWALSLASGLPRNISAGFAERLKNSGEDRFAASLVLFKKALDTAQSVKGILPAAAAAAWYVDSVYAPLPAPPVASLASFVNILADSDSQAVASVLSEFSDIEIAFSEWVALIWVVFQKNPASFPADFGLSPDSVERALKKAWELKGGLGAVVPDKGELTPQAVRAADRMSVFAEGPISDTELLMAFANLRSDRNALRAFRLGARYGTARIRVAAAFDAILVSAEKNNLNPALRALRVPMDPSAYMDSAVVISYAALEGGAIRPDRFVPALAPALAKALGRTGDVKKKEEAVSWLEERGIFFSLPFIARATPPTAEELELLSEGNGFYPAAPGRDSESARNELLRNRIAIDASRLGIPLRFVDSRFDVARNYAALYSCAGRYVELSRKKAGQ